MEKFVDVLIWDYFIICGVLVGVVFFKFVEDCVFKGEIVNKEEYFVVVLIVILVGFFVFVKKGMKIFFILKDD